MQVISGRKTDPSRFQLALGGGLGAPGPSIATPHFNIASLPALGALGLSVAQSVSIKCETDRATLEGWFNTTVPHFDIVIANLSQMMDGSGGAYHLTCSATTIYCDVRIYPALDPAVTCALAAAEMVEVYEASTGGLWNCGASNGEGLSRVLAAALYPHVLDDYAVASAWLDSYRPDYVNVTAPSDTDVISNACSVLFLNYLHYLLKFSWAQICQAAAQTLRETYALLANDANNPFPKFKSILDHMYPPDQPSGLATDNPWA